MRDMLVTRWSEVGDKMVKLAEEFPEDRDDAHPVADIRSFADQLRHVAFWNRYVQKTLRRRTRTPTPWCRSSSMVASITVNSWCTRAWPASSRQPRVPSAQ